MIAFVRESTEGRSDIWWLRRAPSSAPEPLVATPAREDLPRLSADGELLAYVSDESGRSEVYLRALSGARATWQVSEGGGEFPQWAPAGDRLFFTHNEDRLVVVDVVREPRLEIGPPQDLYSSTQRQLGHTHGYVPIGSDHEVVTVVLDISSDARSDLTLITAWPGP